MPNGAEVFVVFNPASGRGTGARRRDATLAAVRAILGDVRHADTREPGDETRLAREAIARGARAVVAVGGDGTWSKTAAGVLASGRDDVGLALLPAGTGNDFERSLGVRGSRRDAVLQAVADDHARRVDVGEVNGRPFLNVVGMGFDIAVIDDAARVGWLRGEAVYRVCALRQLFRYRGRRIEVQSDDGGHVLGGRWLMLVFSNGEYFGGAFHVAPDAHIDDGRLDAVAIGDAGPLRRVRLFGAVARGVHASMPEVTTRRAARFRVATLDGGPLRYEIDGDVYQADDGRLDIRCRPGALRVFAP